jgi:hypothetical protein
VCYESECVDIEIEDGKDMRVIVKGSCPMPQREKLEELGKALTHPDAKVAIQYQPVVEKKSKQR